MGDDAEGLLDEKLREAFDASPTGIGFVAPDGRWLLVNRPLCRLLGHDVGEGDVERLVVGAVAVEAFSADTRVVLAAALDEVAAGRRDVVTIDSILTGAVRGVPTPVRVTLTRAGPAGPDLPAMILQIEDRTGVLASEHRLEALLSRMHDHLSVIDDDARWVWASPSWAHVLGSRPKPGDGCLDVVHPDDRPELLEQFAGVRAGRPSMPTRYRVRVAGGTEGVPEWHWFEARARNLRHDPAIGGYLVESRDVDAEMRVEAALAHRSAHDALTGLPNASNLADALTRLADGATATGRPFAVAVIDLDEFRLVNQSVGRSTGDDLLKLVGQRLAEHVRPTDIVARLDGDDFVVAIAGPDPDEDHEQDPEHDPDHDRRDLEDLIGVYLDHLLDVVRRTQLDGHEGAMTASAGVALALAGTKPETVLAEAEVAMREAKTAGRDRWVLHEPSMSARVAHGVTARRVLRHALDADRVRMRFQPIVDAPARSIVGGECLVRIEDDDGNLVPPGDFVPTAEQTGAIVQLGEVALRAATRTAATWPTSRYVAVNVSARQLTEPGFEAVVHSAIADARLDPGQLVLEVTESALVAADDIERVAASMHRLAGRGVRFALDDFGTGFSSLDRLRQLPFHTIKIDRSFVDQVTNIGSVGGLVVVKSIIAMGDLMGLNVIAEGVETRSQEAILTRVGIRFAQGYRYGRPETDLPDALGELDP